MGMGKSRNLIWNIMPMQLNVNLIMYLHYLELPLSGSLLKSKMHYMWGGGKKDDAFLQLFLISSICRCLDYAGFISYTFSSSALQESLNVETLFSALFNEVVHFVSLYLLQVTFPTKPCPQQAPCHGSRASSAMPTIPAFDTQPPGNLQESLETSTIPCKLTPTAEDFEITL